MFKLESFMYDDCITAYLNQSQYQFYEKHAYVSNNHENNYCN